MNNNLEIALRLCYAAFLGGLIGLERERHGRPAGFRTHLLVAVGSALTMLVSLHLYDLFKIYNTNNYGEAIILAVNLGEDADTVGAVTGQLAGAYYAYGKNMKKWAKKIYQKNKIIDLSLKLYNYEYK